MLWVGFIQGVSIYSWNGIDWHMKNYSIVSLASAALIASAWAFPVLSQEEQRAATGLPVIWSTPITIETVAPPQVGKPYIEPRSKGVSLGQSAVRRGEITFLARQWDYSRSAAVTVLLEGFEQNGFQKIVPIQVKGAPAVSPPTSSFFDWLLTHPSRTPYIGSLTVDSEDRVFVGGMTDSYSGSFDSTPHSRAYLARLDSAGASVWERSYDAGRAAFVVSMTPASAGNVLVAAQDGITDSLWLAMIASDDGNVIWERKFGKARAIAVTRGEGDVFFVASFDSTNSDGAYEDRVVVSKVTSVGQVGPATIIRQSTNQQRNSFYGNLSISSVGDGAYVVSSWEDPFKQNPALLKATEIARVDSEGRLLWRMAIPMSFVVNTNRDVATFCEQPAVATLPNGDALVACALKGKIYTHVFNGQTGEDRQAGLPLPACNDGEHPVTLSLFVLSNERVLVSGTRPDNNVAAGCSWLARLPVSGT